MLTMEFIKLGWVQSAHGLKGEVFIRLLQKDLTVIKKVKSFRLVRSDRAKKTSHLGEIVEKKPEGLRPYKEGLVVKLSGVNDRDQAETLRGYTFEIPKSLLVSRPGERIFLNEILGFKVIDLHSQKEGEIVSFSSNGAQDLLVVRESSEKLKEGTEIQKPLPLFEIPLVQAFIHELDFERKVIEMNLPEGLFGEI